MDNLAPERTILGPGSKACLRSIAARRPTVPAISCFGSGLATLDLRPATKSRQLSVTSEKWSYPLLDKIHLEVRRGDNWSGIGREHPCCSPVGGAPAVRLIA